MPKLVTVTTNFDAAIYKDTRRWIAALCDVLPVLLAEQPLRGDMVHDKACGNRLNDGKAVFDGKVWHELDRSIEEFGALPHFISHPEFPLGSHFHLIVNRVLYGLGMQKIVNCISWVLTHAPQTIAG